MDIVRYGAGSLRIVAVHGIQGTRAVWRPLADRLYDDAVAWTWQAIRTTDQRAALKDIDIPALIVHGDN